MTDQFMLIGMLTVIVFLVFPAFMKKSNQRVKLKASTTIPFGEFNSLTATEVTIEAFASGWITDVSITISVDQISHDCAIGVLVTGNQDSDFIGQNEPKQLHIMESWRTGVSATIGSIEGSSIPKYFYLRPTDGLISYNYNLYELVDAGESIKLYVFPHDLVNTLTAGDVHVEVKADFHIGAFSGERKSVGSRRTARGMEVAVLAIVNQDNSLSHWAPPCSGRISNIRITDWENSLTNDEFAVFGKKTDIVEEDTAEEWALEVESIILPPVNTNAGSALNYDINTVKSNREIFVKKGELIQMMVHQDNSSQHPYSWTFDFTPDFGASVNLPLRWQFENVTNTVLFRVREVQFDMFIEKIEVDIRANDNISCDIFIVGLKDTPDTLGDYTQTIGTMLNTNIVTDSVNSLEGALSPVIIGTMQLSNPERQRDHIVEVFDYYPAGSVYGIVIDAVGLAETEDITVLYRVVGKSRVKSNRRGSSNLDGSLVYDHSKRGDL